MIVKSDAVQFLDGAEVIRQAFVLCLCALCVCRPSAGLLKTQLFNEHIDQCFSHLHFPPQREKERKKERGRGEEKDREKRR